MLRFLVVAAMLVGFAVITTDGLSPPLMVAAKCTGQDPCTACTNCHRCGYCKGGGTCGACKHKKKLLAAATCGN